MTETLKPPMAPMSEVTSLIDEVRRLREALSWYANPQTRELVGETGNPYEAFVPILEDSGERARKALELSNMGCLP